MLQCLRAFVAPLGSAFGAAGLFGLEIPDNVYITRMLHRAWKVRGHHIHAADGPIGHVDDYLFDHETWAIRYLVVDTSNWIGGKTVLISTDVVLSIDSVERQIQLSISRADVEAGPSLDAADIPLSERLPTIWIM
jgi:hypothetical protein